MSLIARRQTRSAVRLVRALSTDSPLPSSSSSSLEPPPPPPRPSRPSRAWSSVGSPTPRRIDQTSNATSIPQIPLRLPPDFGRNQLLAVPNSKRALLEEIVGTFRAPIKYAFAYGSGVFEQEGTVDKDKTPMLDFIFAVSHPEHWHSINLAQNPGHYATHARLLGSDFIGRVQNWGPSATWFNPFVPVNGVNIKYGVVSVDRLCTDLLTWNSLYLAGRMHKPLRIIKDDARVRLTQQVNLASAIRTALLMLPETFEEGALFETIARLSYDGDLRMILPFENRNKILNIVSAQNPQFKELYRRLVLGLPGVQWAPNSTSLSQDISPQARSAHIRKLPSVLRTRIDEHFSRLPDGPQKEQDESAYWVRIASDTTLGKVIRTEINSIVRHSSTIQSAKGLITAGPGQSLRYLVAKASKYWKSRA